MRAHICHAAHIPSMTVDPTRMQAVRHTLLQYGGSAYLRSNFFQTIPQKEWNSQVEPKVKQFTSNPNFVGYEPAGKLPNSLEGILNPLANLIIKLEDENA